MATNLDTKDMELVVSYGDAIAETFQFSKALTKTADAIKSLTGASIGYNHEGTQTAFTLKQLLADGRTLTTVFKRLGDTETFNVLSQSISNVKNALAELRRAGEAGNPITNFAQSRKASLDAQKDAAERALKERFAPNSGSGSDAEKRALNQAIGKVTANIGKSGQDLKSLEDIFRRLTAGATDFTVAEQKIVSQFQAIEAAAARVGSTAKKADDAAIASSEKKFEALRKLNEKLREGDAAAIAAAAKAREAVLIEVEQARASARATEALRAKISAQKEFARQGISDATRASGRKGNFAEETAVDNAIARVANNIGKTVPDAAALSNIFNRLIAGANDFTVEEQKIVAQFQAVSVAASKLGSTQAAIDQAALDRGNKYLFNLVQQGEKLKLKADALERAKQEAEKLARAEAATKFANFKADTIDQNNRDTAKAAAIAAAEAGIKGASFTKGATFADDKGLQTFNTAVTRAIKIVADGKVTITEFNKILGGLDGGTIQRGLSPALDQLQKRLLLVREAAQADGKAIAAAMKEAADAAVALGIKLAKVRADAAVITNKRITDSSTHSALSGAVGGEFANQLKYATPTQLIAYNAALNQAIKLVTDGKVKASEFIAVLNNVQTGKLTTGLTGDQAKLQSSLAATSGAFKNLGKDGESAGNSIFLSWQNVVRIFEAQLLYGIFNQLQSGFSGATQAAADYSRQIALIQTISQDAGISTGEWAEQIRRVSDNLGLGIVDTAAAGYEALSNQVAKGGDAFKFLGTAGTFAKTTGSNITDSVDLISSALNSFELDASQAERVAKSFFTTIDLGRVKTPELANSFGRSGVLAHQLGISLEELNASISTLTRQGIKPNEAYTLLNNVFQKLIKPTEALEGFFRKIGVASGEQAIQTYGYIGVLELLDKAFKGSASEAAKYFDEIRGGRGARNLTGSGLVQLKNDLQQNLGSGENYENAKGIVEKSFGQQFEVETNKIKNFFVKDVGGTFLSTIINLSKYVGGLSNAFITVVAAMKQVATVGLVVYAVSKITPLIAAIKGVAAAYYATGYASQFAAFNSARAGATIAASMAVATLGVSLLIAAVVAVALAFTEFGNKADREIRELKDKIQEAADARIADEDKNADKAFQAFSAGLKNSEVAFLKFTATLRSEYSKTISVLKEESESIGDALKAQFDLINNLVRSNLQELETNLKKTVDNIHKIRDAIIEGPRKRNEDIYEGNLKTNERNVKDHKPDERLAIDQARIEALSKQAKVQFDANDVVGGIRTLDEIEKIIKALGDLERNTKISTNVLSGFHKVLNTTIVGQRAVIKERNGREEIVGYRNLTVKEQQLQAKFKKQTIVEHNAPYRDFAYEAGNQLLEARTLLLDKVLEKQLKLRDAAEAEVNERRKHFEQLQEAQKNLLKFKLYDRKGDIKEEFRGVEGEKRARETIKKLQNAVTEHLVPLGDTPSEIHTRAGFAKQAADLDEIYDNQRNNIGQTAGAESTLKGLEDTVTEHTRRSAQLLDAKGKIKAADAEALRIQEEQTKNLRVQLATIGKILGGVGSGTAIKARINVSEAESILGKGKLTEADVARVKKLYIEIAAGYDELNDRSKGVGHKLGIRSSLGQTPTGEVGNDGEKNPTLEDSVASAGRSITALAPSIKERETLKLAAEKVTEALAETNRQILILDPSFVAAGEGAQNFASTTIEALSPLQKLLAEVNSGLSSLKAEVPKLKALEASLPQGPPRPSSSTGAEPEGRANGGRVGYYASGGFLGDFLQGKYAKGTDVIPTMLTKGEYVVDAANTRKFLPILQSMSAGKFGGSDRGGNSTTNVGDINITVQGGSTSPQTIKEIGSGLRRAVRQGTIKLSR